MSSSKEEFYEVEKILNKKVEKGIVYYLLKWVGYPESKSTWEPEYNLEGIKDMIESFQSNDNNLYSNSKYLPEDSKFKHDKKKLGRPKKCIER